MRRWEVATGMRSDSYRMEWKHWGCAIRAGKGCSAVAYSKVLVIIAIGDVPPQRKHEKHDSHSWTRHKADAELHSYTQGCGEVMGGFVSDTVAVCAEYDVKTRRAWSLSSSNKHVLIHVLFQQLADSAKWIWGRFMLIHCPTVFSQHQISMMRKIYWLVEYWLSLPPPSPCFLLFIAQSASAQIKGCNER